MNQLLEKYIKIENNIFQSQIWQSYYSSLEKDTFWVNCNDTDVLLIKLPLVSRFSYLYCPRAPQTSEEGWRLFLNKCKEIAKKENAVFLRVEPFVVKNGLLKKLGFIKVMNFSPLSRQFSPMNTLLLDISKPEEKLLAEMKPKWRYNIKLAEKKGVKTRAGKSEADLKKFYELSCGMEKRGYSSHSYEHYKKLVDILEKSKSGKFLIAEHEGEIIAAIIVTMFNKVAIYLHGASSDSKRELMPNHLLQWEAIKLAKNQGCEVYDFWGIAPEDVKNHDWAGITRFKLGFGGEKVQFLGAFDYTFSKFWYIIFCSVNVIRKAIKR